VSAPPVALVTGGAVRVGRTIVEHLAASGYRVWLHHHGSVDAAREIRARLPNIVGAPRADLLDARARAELLRTVLDPAGPAGGRLDLLVNCAASFERGPFLDRTDEDLQRVLSLLLTAPLSLARGAHPALSVHGGCIINIGDLLARHPSPGHLDHSVAKAALEAATRALALELAPVRVCGIVPGSVLWPATTSLSARAEIASGTALGRIASPNDVAEAVLFLARNASMTGENVVIDAGQGVGTGRRP